MRHPDYPQNNLCDVGSVPRGIAKLATPREIEFEVLKKRRFRGRPNSGDLPARAAATAAAATTAAIAVAAATAALRFRPGFIDVHGPAVQIRAV
jgi:hypothetical protein